MGPARNMSPYRLLGSGIVFGLLFVVVLVGLEPVMRSLEPDSFLLRDDIKDVLRHEQTLIEAKGKIIYIGDSTVRFHSRGEADTRSQAALLEEFFTYPVLTASHGAYGAREAEAVIQACDRLDCRPEVVVIGVNLGSFSRAWELVPYYDHSLRRFCLRTGWITLSHLWSHLHAPSQLSNPFSWAERHADSLRRVEQVTRDSPPDRQYMNRYGGNLDDSLSFPALERVLKKLAERNQRTLLYLTPINFEDIRRTCPPEQIRRLEDRRRRILAVLESSGHSYLDLSEAVPNDGFDYGGSTVTEHLISYGRKLVAFSLVAKLRETRMGQATEESR